METDRGPEEEAVQPESLAGGTVKAASPRMRGAAFMEGKRLFLTAFFIILVLLLGVVLYLLRYRPQEFFYVLF